MKACANEKIQLSDESLPHQCLNSVFSYKSFLSRKIHTIQVQTLEANGCVVDAGTAVQIRRIKSNVIYQFCIDLLQKQANKQNLQQKYENERKIPTCVFNSLQYMLIILLFYRTVAVFS